MTINNKKISKSEFVDWCNKNIPENIKDNQDSTREFLKAFIDFKTTVLEAENQKIDTSNFFINEFSKYKRLLLLRYLVDNNLMVKLTKEAYQRMNKQFRVRQILVKLDFNASPKDTLVAYQKSLKIIKRLSAGEDFETLANQVSDDPSTSGNHGDLWYIGPFSLPYNLENYVYNLSSNPIKYSGPIRTHLGYHIIEITNTRNNPGIYKVDHILLSASPDTSKQAEVKVKQLADSIYFQLRIGQDFGKLAIKYTKDFGNDPNSGALPWFESGDMPHEFELAAYSLVNDGDISKPVQSRFGWHIIKRINQKNIPEYSQIEDQLIDKVINGDRGELAIQKAVSKLKQELNFTDFNTLPVIIGLVDSTIFDAEWKIPELSDLSGFLFSIDNHNYTQLDFAKYIESTQIEKSPIPIDNYLFGKFDEYVNNKLLLYKENKLLQEENNYKKSVNSARDNLLYYSLMQKEVWDKSDESKGFTQFYNNSKEENNNYYNAEVSIFTFKTDQTEKLGKNLIKLKESNNSDSEIESKIQSSQDKDFKLCEPLSADELNLMLKKCLALNEGHAPISEKLFVFQDEKKIIWLNSEIKKLEISEDQLMDKATSEYQKKIEGTWLNSLKQKYQVEINESIFNSIFKN